MSIANFSVGTRVYFRPAHLTPQDDADMRKRRGTVKAVRPGAGIPVLAIKWDGERGVSESLAVSIRRVN
jgi:hypothetical protein